MDEKNCEHVPGVLHGQLRAPAEGGIFQDTGGVRHDGCGANPLHGLIDGSNVLAHARLIVHAGPFVGHAARGARDGEGRVLASDGGEDRVRVEPDLLHDVDFIVNRVGQSNTVEDRGTFEYASTALERMTHADCVGGHTGGGVDAVQDIH